MALQRLAFVASLLACTAVTALAPVRNRLRGTALLRGQGDVVARRRRIASGALPMTMRWQSVSSSVEVPASADAAFGLYKDLNRHPEWSLW